MKKERGITLIALVITIILMLILAGIVIRLSLGENGIFEKTKIAKKENDRASLEEELQLRYSNEVVKQDGVEVDFDEFISNLPEEYNIQGSTQPYTITKNRQDYSVVYVDGKIHVQIKAEEVSHSQTFGFKQEVQSFIVPHTGIYTLEVWGAQGGSDYGGKGGYAKGMKVLTEGQTLYIVTGGQGASDSSPTAFNTGGYNGGGAGGYGANWCSPGSGGGGATHIALGNNLGELKNYNESRNDILIVAGGGRSEYVEADPGQDFLE